MYLKNNGERKALVFPGAFQMVKNYGDFPGTDIWLQRKDAHAINGVTHVIAHSLGAAEALRRYTSDKNIRFILVNPLLEKKNIFVFLWKWIKFILIEGIAREKIIPAKEWLYALKKTISLLKTDVLEELKKVPYDHVIITRGNHDFFFCTKQSAHAARKEGFRVIEADAGHDWNDNISQIIQDLL
jgi:hypothetical protein